MSNRKNLSRPVHKNPSEKPIQTWPRYRSIGIGLAVLAFVFAVVAVLREVTPPWIRTEIMAGGSTVQEVSYPVSMFDDGKAHHFESKTSDGKTVRYFILKSSDGVVRAAFDACVVCWREGKGYFQKDDVMVCRNCGRRFPSSKINVITGGCNPAPLTRTVEGDKLIIKAESIQEGKQYFAF